MEPVPSLGEVWAVDVLATVFPDVAAPLIDRRALGGQPLVLQAVPSDAVPGFAPRVGKGRLGAFAERACVHQSHVAHKPSRLGADQVIDYTARRFEDALEPVNRVFDTVGGEVLDRSLRATRRDGLVVSIAGAPEPQAAIMEGMGRFPEALFWLASLSVRRRAHRVGVGYRYLFMRPDGQQLAEISRLVDEGKLRVLMDSVVPFDQALDALAHVETGRARGKIVLSLRARES